MILADKIIRLRKKNGWSQEELAEKMNISRQAVSKWEGAQSAPDLEKLLQLSALFGVTTDYLLKDDIEDEVFTDDALSTEKRVTLEDAHAFLSWREKASVRIALATFLCILAPVPLLILGAASAQPAFHVSENLACGIGLIVLLVIVAIAVTLYILCGFKNAPYAFLDEEPFEIEYGVAGMVKERRSAFKDAYMRLNLSGVCLCVLSPVPLFCGIFTQNAFVQVLALIATMLIAGIGTALFIIAGVRWASMNKLLKEGEFTQREKEKSRVKSAVAAFYWLCATALYLGISLITNDWNSTWVVWPVAGVLFAGVMALCSARIDA